MPCGFRNCIGSTGPTSASCPFISQVWNGYADQHSASTQTCSRSRSQQSEGLSFVVGPLHTASHRALPGARRLPGARCPAPRSRRSHATSPQAPGNSTASTACEAACKAAIDPSKGNSESLILDPAFLAFHLPGLGRGPDSSSNILTKRLLQPFEANEHNKASPSEYSSASRPRSELDKSAPL